ncbi:MAG: hypothetical protein A07HR60_00953 [uncultured archaeon A07HR60]|nr:MAG: hypothetical protein A07HR60_00953 [uncultured archaeon A07HR60]
MVGTEKYTLRLTEIRTHMWIYPWSLNHTKPPSDGYKPVETIFSRGSVELPQTEHLHD